MKPLLLPLIYMITALSCQWARSDCSHIFSPPRQISKPNRGQVHHKFKVAAVRKDDEGNFWQLGYIAEHFPNFDGTSTRVIHGLWTEGIPFSLNENYRLALLKGEINPEDLPKEAFDLTMEEWFQTVQPLIEKANGAFERRRGWGNDFSEKNIAVAKKYLPFSTYVEVRDSKTERLLGGARLISLPEKSDLKLPEFEYLNIDMHPKNNTKFKREVGALVIDESLNEQQRTTVWINIWSQIFRTVFGGISFHMDDYDLLYDQSMHLYADAKSLALYLPLGFKHLREYQIDGKKVEWEGDSQPLPIEKISKDGTTVQWWPLVMHAPDLLQARPVMASRRLRHIDEDQFISFAREMIYRDTSLLEFGGTIEQCLRHAHEDSVLGIASITGIVEWLAEVDLHHRAVRENKNRSSEAYSSSILARVSKFKEQVDIWFSQDRVDIVESVLASYLSSFTTPEINPYFSKYLVGELFPRIFVYRRQQLQSRGIRSEVFHLLDVFYSLPRALSPQHWIENIGPIEVRDELPASTITALRLALFETRTKVIRDGSHSVASNLSDRAFIQFLFTEGQITEETFKLYLKRAAEAQMRMEN